MSEHACKGTHLTVARTWFDERVGPGSLDQLTNKAYPGMIMPGAWYPVEPLARAFDGAAAKLARPAPELVAEVARRNALQDLTSIYRVFLRVLSPVRLLSFTPQLWRSYVRFAEATVLRNDPGHYVGLCDGVPKHLLDWCCGGWLGFLPAGIELADGKAPAATIRNTRFGRDEVASFECEIRYGMK